MVSYLTSLPLCEEFARGVHCQCCYILLQLRYLPVSLTKFKGVQIGDHEIKKVNFSNETTIFLGDITYLNRIRVISKLYEATSSSHINFSKTKPYGLQRTKIELINHDKWNGHNFPLKYLELILVTVPSIIPIRTK